MRLSVITRAGPKSDNKCPHKRKEEGDLPRGEGQGKAKAETEVIHLQNEERPRIAGKRPAQERRRGPDSPSKPPGGSNPASTLVSDFWPPGL